MVGLREKFAPGEGRHLPFIQTNTNSYIVFRATDPVQNIINKIDPDENLYRINREKLIQILFCTVSIR